MIFDQLSVRNVRNVSSETLELHPSVNVLIGPNGSGKTTLLESIHALVRGRSFRPGGLNSLISFGCEELLITGRGNHRGRDVRLGIEKSHSANVRMRMNGRDVRQTSQVAATVPLQVFLPDVPDLVFGKPALRRMWLDWGIFHTNPEYLSVYRSFLRTLRQRNRALKSSPDEWQSWTSQFVSQSEAMTQHRENFLRALNERFTTVLEALAPDLQIHLQYTRGWSDFSLTKSLEKQRHRELQYGVTNLGPHRSDVHLLVVDEGNENSTGSASRILSRGQGKAVASAMKIAQVEYLHERSIPSVVLLDDVASEFDEKYGKRFFELLSKTQSQVIATTTQKNVILDMWPDSNRESTSLFSVRAGKFSKIQYN